MGRFGLQGMKAAVASVALCLPVMGAAEEVTLKSREGAADISGALISFQDDIYTIDSDFGILRIMGKNVECVGDGCPVFEGMTVVWDVSLWGSRRAFTEHVERLSELVAEKTEGKFSLNISYGGLAKSRENLDGISEGKFEMAQFCAGYHPEKNPSITVLELPFLGVDTLEQEIELSMAVYNHPATREDLGRWNATPLMPSPLPQYNIVGTGFPPTSLDDFVGMPVRATGGVGAAIASMGSELVNLAATEVEQAMADGTVRAVSFAPHAHMAFGTIESGTWWTTNLNPGTVNCPVVANSKALDRLPESYRDALLSSIDAALEHYVDNYNGATMDAWTPALSERGIAELTISDAILADIREAVAAPAAAKWVAENTARGLPARELYNLVTGLVADGAS